LRAALDLFGIGVVSRCGSPAFDILSDGAEINGVTDAGDSFHGLKSPYAGGDHFVVCLGLRVVLPLFARCVFAKE
jgi:hypothetical protein